MLKFQVKRDNPQGPWYISATDKKGVTYYLHEDFYVRIWRTSTGWYKTRQEARRTLQAYKVAKQQ